MAYKNTVAIIGAAGTTGAILAKAISKCTYRVLLMDQAGKQLTALQTKIATTLPTSEVEVIDCCKDASWEADVIIISVAKEELETTAEKMKEVATCKTIIHFNETGSNNIDLQKLLPNSKVVNVYYASINENSSIYIKAIDGIKNEALKMTREILEEIGLTYNVE